MAQLVEIAIASIIMLPKKNQRKTFLFVNDLSSIPLTTNTVAIINSTNNNQNNQGINILTNRLAINIAAAMIDRINPLFWIGAFQFHSISPVRVKFNKPTTAITIINIDNGNHITFCFYICFCDNSIYNTINLSSVFYLIIFNKSWLFFSTFSLVL